MRTAKDDEMRCGGYWLINSEGVGECLKYVPDADLAGCVCGDTGEPCPYEGTRDFKKLQAQDKLKLQLRGSFEND